MYMEDEEPTTDNRLMEAVPQSMPSPKAEPFKRWLARIGKERIDEIENPELSMARMQELYEKKGYPVDPHHARRGHHHHAAPGSGFAWHATANK
jgi:hypothetical protein